MRHLLCACVALFAMSSPVSAQSGQWSFRAMTDPITDKVRGIGTVASDGYLLMVKCDFEYPGVYVSLAGPGAGFFRNKDITYRFDSNQPVTSNWIKSNNALILGTDVGVTAFVRGARPASRIVIRIPGVSASSQPDDVIFSGAGASATIAQVYRTCGQALP